MHGLVNRAIQRFVTDTYGPSRWVAAMELANLGVSDFEAMMIYADDVTPRTLAAVCETLDRSHEELLEDIGTYLVSHPNVEALRRLLRFGGFSFIEFLHSLDDLRDRARLAVPDLEVPRLELFEVQPDLFTLKCAGPIPGCGYLLMGTLRAMADDYGALVFLEHQGCEGLTETLAITLLETEYTQGRGFELGVRAG